MWPDPQPEAVEAKSNRVLEKIGLDPTEIEGLEVAPEYAETWGEQFNTTAQFNCESLSKANTKLPSSEF